MHAELLVKEPFKAGWSSAVEGRMALSRGNVALLDIGGSIQAQFQSLFEATEDESSDRVPFVRQRLVVRGDGQFAQQGGDPFIAQSFAYSRWTRMWHPWVGSDVFSQLQYNRFLKLQSRLLAGAGVRFHVLHGRSLLAYGGSGYMIERESIEVTEGADDRSTQINHRWTNFLTVRADPLSGRFLIQDTVYVQPRFDRPDDIRVLNTLEALAVATESLALGVTVAVLFDSAPPTSVERTDLRFQSSVRLTF